MTPRQLAIGTRWLHDYHSALAFRGYHAWAIPTVRLMRRSPKLSWVMEKLFVARAEELQAYYGIGKPSLKGFAARKVIEPLSWAVGIGVWLLDARPDPQVLYPKPRRKGTPR